MLCCHCTHARTLDVRALRTVFAMSLNDTVIVPTNITGLIRLAERKKNRTCNFVFLSLFCLLLYVVVIFCFPLVFLSYYGGRRVNSLKIREESDRFKT